MDPSELPSSCVLNWSDDEVQLWLKTKNYPQEVSRSFGCERVDGKALLLLNEDDLKTVLTNQVFSLYFHDHYSPNAVHYIFSFIYLAFGCNKETIPRYSAIETR